MDTFHRARRDPATDTQFVWLASLLVGVAVIAVFSVVSGGLVSTRGGVSSTMPSMLDIGPEYALIGLIGIALATLLIVRLRRMLRGEFTLVIEATPNRIRWDSRGVSKK